jgi:hypothetical protein
MADKIVMEVRAVSVGSRLFTAIGVLLVGAGVVGWVDSPPASVTTVVSIVAVLLAVCAVVAAFQTAQTA